MKGKAWTIVEKMSKLKEGKNKRLWQEWWKECKKKGRKEEQGGGGAREE